MNHHARQSTTRKRIIKPTNAPSASTQHTAARTKSAMAPPPQQASRLKLVLSAGVLLSTCITIMATKTTAAPPSPKVTEISWGRVSVEGREGCSTFKDVKLYPGGAREWDWGETGTRHSPGIHPDDVDELISSGATTVVLSQGVHKRLKVRPETLRKLQDRGAEFEVLQTEKAVERYNELVKEGVAVGALIHSTC